MQWMRIHSHAYRGQPLIEYGSAVYGMATQNWFCQLYPGCKQQEGLLLEGVVAQRVNMQQHVTSSFTTDFEEHRTRAGVVGRLLSKDKVAKRVNMQQHVTSSFTKDFKEHRTRARVVGRLLSKNRVAKRVKMEQHGTIFLLHSVYHKILHTSQGEFTIQNSIGADWVKN